MKNCPLCHRTNADNARYCVNCNTAFGAIGAATCPKGHTIDPTWTECPYCKGQAAAAGPQRSKTVVEGPAATPPPPPPPVVSAGTSAGPVRRMTVFAPPPQETGVETPRAAQRKIVGILITYSWRAEGQLFPIREGRNLIGRGAECEVQVSEDNTLSNINSHITYRKSFTVGDMVSMSGTDVNGVPVEEQFVGLESGARIRTGSTHWTFLAVNE